MPRFYFDIRDSLGVIPDSEGLDLPSLRSAIVEAERSAASIAEQRKQLPSRCFVEVRDEQGLVLAVVPVFLPI